MYDCRQSGAYNFNERFTTILSRRISRHIMAFRSKSGVSNYDRNLLFFDFTSFEIG